MSLMQEPPGTRKMATLAPISCYLTGQSNAPLLFCAPTDTVVHQLTEKIYQTGLRVMLFCFRTQDPICPCTTRSGTRIVC